MACSKRKATDEGRMRGEIVRQRIRDWEAGRYLRNRTSTTHRLGRGEEAADEGQKWSGLMSLRAWQAAT
jgi:hypothetical protein